jgi:hypothetical protein
MSVHVINLNKSDEGNFGFSLLGKFAGIPHVIYDVIEDSPAAESEVSQKNFNKKKISFIGASSLFLRRIHVING